MQLMSAQAVAAFVRGERPEHLVNPTVLEEPS
jgi:hypothetical protein